MKDNDQSWCKCVYCGEFVSYKDIERGLVKTQDRLEIVGGYPGEPEHYTEVYHVKCKKRDKED